MRHSFSSHSFFFCPFKNLLPRHFEHETIIIIFIKMDFVDLDFLENIAFYEPSECSEDSKHPLSVVEESLVDEMKLVEQELYQLNTTSIRNKGRKRQRLLDKKEKMKVQLQLVYRNLTSPRSLTPKDRKQLYYLTSKYSSEAESEAETDSEFLHRTLCVELGLTYDDWEPYFN
jgi:hypothetical protein